MSTPTVTVVIPVYNTEDYLPACLDSVLEQALRDLEVLAIDDGSTDDSRAILERRAATDPRLQVLDGPDRGRGPGAARNLAIERARGEYLAFVDSDDLLDPSMLEKLVAEARRGAAEIAICLVEKFNEDAEQRFAPCSYGKTIPRELDGHSFTWRELGADLFELRFTACNKIYDRRFLASRGIRFGEDRFYEDLTFTFEALLQATSLRLVREGLYLNRRQRPGATTFTQGSRVFDAFAAMEDLESFLRAEEAYATLLPAFEAFRFGRLRRYLYKNDPEHLPEFYQRLQAIAMRPELADNPYVTEKDRVVLDRLPNRTNLEFLTEELWRLQNRYSGARRRIYNLKAQNRHLERRLRQSQGSRFTPRRLIHGVRWRLRKRFPGRQASGAASQVANEVPAESASAEPARGDQGVAAGTGTPAAKGTGSRASKKDPIGKYPRDSNANAYDAIDLVRSLEVDRRQSELVDRIRHRLASDGDPLRVAFVVNEAAKWNATSLVDAMAKEPRIEARILLSWYPIKAQPQEERLERYATQRRDLEEAHGLPVVELYDHETGLPTPIEDVDDDILFLQQPWGMKDFPRRLLGRALPVYLHYGFMVMANHGMHYNIGTFHPYLWRYFAQTEGHRQLHIQHDPGVASRIEVTGYPKLDVYLDPEPAEVPAEWQDRALAAPPRKRVVFAPHHALGRDNLGMSTFRWSHDVLLDLARRHTDIQWLYKPHPNLRYSVVRNKVMTREQYLDYEAAWQALPNAVVYDDGDYFDHFRTSDALITDCGSFLAEYLPTGGPILWLVSDQSVGLNEVGETLAEGYYRITSPGGVEERFHQVVLDDEDPLGPVRRRLADRLFPHDERAADRVVGSLRETFELGR